MEIFGRGRTLFIPLIDFCGLTTVNLEKGEGLKTGPEFCGFSFLEEEAPFL